MAQYRDMMNALAAALDTASDDSRDVLRDTITDYRAKYDHGHYPPLLRAMFDAIDASLAQADDSWAPPQ